MLPPACSETLDVDNVIDGVTPAAPTSDAFRAISDADLPHYHLVKEALLARYAVTPEAYRRRFRESQKKGGDSYTEWACRLHLRDTGATLTLLQPHLVKNKDRTGHTVAVRVAGGAVFRLPTARVHLDWGAGSGRVQVGLMDNLPAEVLLGNDLGPMTSAYATPGPASINPVTTRSSVCWSVLFTLDLCLSKSLIRALLLVAHHELLLCRLLVLAVRPPVTQCSIG
ncbi:uncharacterized protein PAF06_003128 [Gastrophryne carolinensis]